MRNPNSTRIAGIYTNIVMNTQTSCSTVFTSMRATSRTAFLQGHFEQVECNLVSAAMWPISNLIEIQLGHIGGDIIQRITWHDSGIDIKRRKRVRRRQYQLRRQASLWSSFGVSAVSVLLTLIGINAISFARTNRRSEELPPCNAMRDGEYCRIRRRP